MSGDERRIPAAIGRYRILRLLGEGGMGAVYEAEQDQPRRLVALKVIRAAWASPDLLRRFGQESQALGRLQHPGIAQIYESGSAETEFGVQPFFAMELIHGRPLIEYAAGRKLNTRQRLELMIQICDAVHHAHQRGIIHRDLKPGNILVDESGQPKILDFGLARATDADAQATRQTDIGQLLGTLAYMSPEQVLADPLALDTRSDVYALGVILYELLAGKLPYLLPKMLHEAVRTIQQADPAPLSSVHRDYRGDIETIVAKALEKDKTRRYASAAELAADIGRTLHDEPIIARPPGAAYQLGKFARRHKALVTGVSAVFVVLVLGIVASTWEAVQARKAEKKARQESAIAKAVNDFLQNDILWQASAYNQSKPDPDLKVRTALDRASQNIQGKFGSEPEVEAAIRTTIGATYGELGLGAEARKQLDRALEMDQRTFGPGDPRTLEGMRLVAWTENGQGKYADAEAMFARTLELDRRVLGQEDERTLRTMEGLGNAFYNEGKYAQAEALLKQALEIDRRALGPESGATLGALVALASVYSGEGKFSEAEALRTQVVEIDRRTLGPEDPSTLNDMELLGWAENDIGKLPQAEATLRQTLESDRRVFGPEHASTLVTAQNLANVFTNEGKYPAAEELDRQVVDVQRRVLGPEHPDTLWSVANLAWVYDREGQYARSEALMAQVVEAERRVLGPENPVTLRHNSSLADIYYGEGKYAQSEALDKQLLAIDRRSFGPENPQTLGVMATLTWVEYLAGDYADAEPLGEKALELHRRVFGAGHPDTVNVAGNLADVYAAEGRYAEAEKLYRQALETGLRTLGAESRQTMEIASDLGIMNQLRSNYALAESYGAQSYTRRRHKFGPRDPHTMASANDYALALVSEGKFAQSELVAREYLAIDKQAYPDHWQRFRAASLLGASLAGEKKYAEAGPLLLEGFNGMQARKERIPAPYRYNLDFARQWLVQLNIDRGKPEQAAEWKKK